MRVETEVLGEKAVLANISKMRERAMDARPVTRKVRDLLVKFNREAFESEGGSVGDPWAPLTKATLERKSREGLDLRPMHGKTGDLAASLTGGKGKRTGATKTTARAGSGVWYARFARGTKGSAASHNTGEAARKLIGLPPGGERKVLDLVAGYVVHGRLL